ncbi:discoidin domain-containing protein [Streptomyces sp. OE57]|uniref:discoidin domain-containing protein n=1 Tax=Streptomyces lacaronensis TaxID=3379885 RepID=UPI0039B78408
MRHHGRRLSAGLVTAGLLTVGLLPVTAHAAEGARAAEGVNPALGRPVTASGAHGSYPASNVTDGSQASYWEGPAGSFPQWVQIDLGSETGLDEVVLKLPASWESRTEAVRVQASTDGQDFTTVVPDVRKDFSPSSGNTVALDVTAEGRYVRVQVTGNTGWNAVQLSEVEVRGEAGGENPGDPPAGTNLALRKPIEASQFVINGSANRSSARRD